MTRSLADLLTPGGAPRYVFFGGKGGVGKTTLATATAVWLADHGLRTTLVSTDPTVSLAAMFDQPIPATTPAPIHQVRNLCGMNINPAEARGLFKGRMESVMNQLADSLGAEEAPSPCADQIAAFDQFVTALDTPDADVVVFDTAPTGKTLRELAMPFDWASYLRRQVQEGREPARLVNLDHAAMADLERDKARYDHAMTVLRDPASTAFVLALLAERLPIEETQSAIDGLDRLGIPVQALVTNQVIGPEVVEGNTFLAARAAVQAGDLAEIDGRFERLLRIRLALLDRDVSDVETLRRIGSVLYGDAAGAAHVSVTSQSRPVATRA
jgi:arsenite-transporting ATPase